MKSLFAKNISSNNLLLKSGREAFSYIISLIKEKNKQINNVLLPNLICEEMISVVQQHNLNILYYSIDNELNYDIDEIKQLTVNNKNILVFVNYFGCKILNKEVSNLKGNNFLIEDNAHVLNNDSNNQHTMIGDYSFSSLRKMLPILSGAEVHSKNDDLNFNSNIRIPNIGELIYSIRGLKKKSSKTSLMGHQKDTNNLDISCIDIFSKFILQRYKFSYQNILSMRRKNFNFWDRYLSRSNLRSMQSITNNISLCPYAYPCYAYNNSDITKWLNWGKEKNISIISWPKYHKHTSKYIPDNHLRKILLFPVNHQFDLSKIIG